MADAVNTHKGMTNVEPSQYESQARTSSHSSMTLTKNSSIDMPSEVPKYPLRHLLCHAIHQLPLLLRSYQISLTVCMHTSCTLFFVPFLLCHLRPRASFAEETSRFRYRVESSSTMYASLLSQWNPHLRTPNTNHSSLVKKHFFFLTHCVDAQGNDT